MLFSEEIESHEVSFFLLTREETDGEAVGAVLSREGV